MNIGAILMLEDASDLDFSTVHCVLESRLPRVRRLRQRLLKTPLGCGRPVWVDDPDFDLGRHLEAVSTATDQPDDLRGLGDDHQILQIAAELVCRPLPRDQPLWRAYWVSGPGADDRAALLLVMHHAMADGVGGLAVLAALADTGDDPDTDPFPQPWPPLRSVVAAVWRERAAACINALQRLRAAGRGVRELGFGVRGRALAARTSMNQPTGPLRRLATVELDVAQVLDVAHRRRCTVNDLALAAVTGAMTAVLEARGEHPGELVVSIPVSARRMTTADELGNQTGVIPLSVPTLTDQDSRLQHIASMSQAGRAMARGASAGPLGIVFRTLGGLGVFQRFIDHQRLVHTFVTNVRGPDAAVHFAGHRIGKVIPVAITPGNIGVCFDILSYAGRLVMTVVTDPDIVREQELLTDLLDDEFARLLAA